MPRTIGGLPVLEGAAQVALDRNRGTRLGDEDQLDVVQPFAAQHPSSTPV